MEDSSTSVTEEFLAGDDGVTVTTENITEEYEYYYDYVPYENAEYMWATRAKIEKYLPPILIIIGITGNILSMVVLSSKRFRKAPSSFVLLALAVADSVVLLTVVLRPWIMSVFGVDVRTLSLASCRIHMFLTYLSTHLSAWTLVLLSLERLISVLIPFRVREICSRQKMIIGWCVLLGILFAINGHMFGTAGIHVFDDGTFCSYGEPGEKFHVFGYEIWPWIDLVVASIAPFFCIFIMNILIIVQVCRARQKRMATMQASSKTADKIQGLTAMLVTISITFLITTGPYTVFIALNNLRKLRHISIPVLFLIYTSFNMLFAVNNSINFFLYCISGSRFRRTLALLCGCKKAGAESTTNGTASHTQTSTVETSKF